VEAIARQTLADAGLEDRAAIGSAALRYHLPRPHPAADRNRTPGLRHLGVVSSAGPAAPRLSRANRATSSNANLRSGQGTSGHYPHFLTTIHSVRRRISSPAKQITNQTARASYGLSRHPYQPGLRWHAKRDRAWGNWR